MRIHNQDKRYVLDIPAFEVFLREQGLSEQEILQLIIHVRIVHPKDPLTYGTFTKPSTIYVYTHGEGLKEVNDTLLHETCHYWQEHQERIRLAQRQREYEQMRKGRKKDDFYFTYICWGDTTKRETGIDYWNRPSEVHARAFAKQHAHQLMVSYQQLYALHVPRSRLHPSQVDRLKAQSKRLIWTEDERHLCFPHLTLKEAQFLIRLLEAFGLRFYIPSEK
ncbi:hypothetical protein KSF_109050 [Reticulibacter mediterranei]|uniref:IrrE N-terminal-like domain-containing protein n=1 Tax=Reticulibacter mediterranei TaxID=2778369 RepID=A0A8J3J1X8_9CHLR|nr:hypothetical protein [Reticulibacter mediterranei]GHP00858.1 hypothetical protein KSF_109050 [Reticulibacter mediterranei]